MNPRDLPEVVSELIIEMHEVRAELSALNGRIDRLDRRVENLETEMRLTREENRENTDRLLVGIQRMLDPFLNRLLEHDDQLRSHQGRLNNLENPTA
ncbi:hypothetical protein E4631_08255 [Hymenobacter sp. UV11]|uniref:hypothetical protein n=1 Tax=Hymenobacter sp. UV11 TaxID=1849735 RepID=UPI00105DEC23|nr:hypothetical protein [Hymenobacter sp. UV11]TDN36240.1 hypothetical protein A8B98_09960 [Hymenobacter sp. UV11]TFZ66945.1 hypothetical protein E4631_08255 [Hymenobacter sp. UV11]